jgi:hypothetical protein
VCLINNEDANLTQSIRLNQVIQQRSSFLKSTDIDTVALSRRKGALRK